MRENLSPSSVQGDKIHIWPLQTSRHFMVAEKTCLCSSKGPTIHTLNHNGGTGPWDRVPDAPSYTTSTQ